MNSVAGSYEGAFDKDIKFEIVEHYVSSCATCDPWPSTTDGNQLLSSFSSWGSSGFTNRHDLGQLWTSRDFCGQSSCGTIGLAWIRAVCGSGRYHILEDFTTVAWQLRVLTVHEIGHNFGANHVNGSGYIMTPSVSTNTTTWSPTSISSINQALDAFTCLEDCVLGSCTEITSASVVGCTPGVPGTYDLSLQIRHGGGGSAASFAVQVNGGSYTYAWAPNPPIVTVPGLIADGTAQNPVTISASDGSDVGYGQLYL